MPTLLDLTDDMRRLDIMLADSDGEITPAIEQALATWAANLDGQFENKVDAYAAMIRELSLRSEARHEEYARLKRISDADAKAADWMTERLKSVFEQRGIKKIETTRFKLSLANNPPRVAIDGDVPADYLYQPPPQPDKNKIGDVLKAGIVLDFARLEKGTRLSIK